MNRRNSALFSALFSLITFSIIPLYAPTQLPIELFDPLIEAGFDIESFTYQIAVIGVLSSILIVIKGFAEEDSYTYLLTALTGNGVSLYFTLATLTLGDITSLGVSTIKMDIGGGSNTLTLDMSIFVWFAILTLVLQVLLNIMTFLDSRKNSSKRRRAEQLAIDAQMQEQQSIHHIIDE